MALAPCRECSRQVSTEASTCPQCGVPFPTRGTGAPSGGPMLVGQAERTWQVIVARSSPESHELLRPLLQASYPSATAADLNDLLQKDEIVVRSGLSQEDANALMQQLHAIGLQPRKIAVGSTGKPWGQKQSVGDRQGPTGPSEVPNYSEVRSPGLVACRACGRQVSALASTCPHCGDRIRVSRRRIDGMRTGEAILWALLCFPVGFVKLGQGVKWLVWVLIALLTGGLGLLPMLVDYFMCNEKARATGILGEWEWFPRV
jgi:RNA polymerase subunit RPABC4/transcription elongation factor Spt4